jgi:hypothetical protein
VGDHIIQKYEIRNMGGFQLASSRRREKVRA